MARGTVKRFNAQKEYGFISSPSTVIPGLYFVGIHFLRKRKSSLLIGVGEDASIIARDIARRKNA
jgi:putative flavoprotein involved in K+ transport